MKKAATAILVFVFLAGSSFAQAPVSSADSLKAAQKSESVKLNKKTIVTKSTPTNWSKIKDLFR
jgi:hypothetical protein